MKELQSLVDYGVQAPALSDTAGTGQWSSGDPFTNVFSGGYWTSTTDVGTTGNAFDVNIGDGRVFVRDKTLTDHVWPVRDGN